MLKFYFDQQPWKDEVSVYIIDERENGKRFLCQPMPMEFKEINPSQESEPSMRFRGSISREFFPKLAQALAEFGYRPESNDAGELLATKVHLADMRRLVLDKKVARDE